LIILVPYFLFDIDYSKAPLEPCIPYLTEAAEFRSLVAVEHLAEEHQLPVVAEGDGYRGAGEDGFIVGVEDGRGVGADERSDGISYLTEEGPTRQGEITHRDIRGQEIIISARGACRPGAVIEDGGMEVPSFFEGIVGIDRSFELSCAVGPMVGRAEVGCRAPEACSLYLPRPAASKHDVIDHHSGQELPVVFPLVEAVHAGDGRTFIAVEAGHQLRRRGRTRVIFQLDGVTARALLVVEVEIGERVEDIVRGPDEAYAPVDALTAGADFELAQRVTDVGPVEVGDDKVRRVIDDEACQVKITIIPGNHVGINGMEELYEITVEHTVAHADVDVETIRGMPPEIEAVVQLIVEEPRLIGLPVPRQLQVLDVTGEGPAAGACILSIGETRRE
jgi:hypothetical protein